MRTFVTSVCVLVALAGSAKSQSEIVAVKDVPATCIKAANQAAPAVEWILARKVVEMDGGKKIDTYRLFGKEKAGKKRTVLYLGRADGKSGFVRIEVKLSDVPEAILKAMKAKHSTFKIQFAQASGLTANNVTAYRLVGKRGSVDAAYVVGLDGKKIIPE